MQKTERPKDDDHEKKLPFGDFFSLFGLYTLNEYFMEILFFVFLIFCPQDFLYSFYH
jgi:hypothetical protein